MASFLQSKALKELNAEEVVFFLQKIQFQKIVEKLLSGDFGVVTGELLGKLDEETLRDGLEITNSFVRQQFIGVLTKYKSGGIPIGMFTTMPDKELEESTLEVPEVEHSQKEVKIRKELNTLLEKSKKFSNASSSSEMEIYAFPVKKTLVRDLKEPIYCRNLKKIIIMGETGTGKSTLLNAIVNFVAGVEIEDPFRFRLVVDESEQATNQAFSQTQEISGYLIQNTELDFDIQIWDTPGFGDTKGVERDEEIRKQIDELLNLEEFCHAIFFVMKASVNRLTNYQKEIINNVRYYFGEEAEENIFLLATFEDGSRPIVYDTLKECEFPFDENRCFVFNNGDLLTPASARTSVAAIFWETVNNSFERLFKAVGEVKPFSLTSTKEDIEMMEDLKNCIDFISDQVDRSSYKNFHWDQSILELSLLSEETQSKTTFKQPTEEIIKVPTKNSNVNCKYCHATCHKGCGRLGVIFCDKLKWNMRCKICFCSYANHLKEKYEYTVQMRTEYVKTSPYDFLYMIEKEKKKRKERINILIGMAFVRLEEMKNLPCKRSMIQRIEELSKRMGKPVTRNRLNTKDSVKEIEVTPLRDTTTPSPTEEREEESSINPGEF